MHLASFSFLLSVGLQELYKGLYPLPCYKRRNGISASVISQSVLHDEGTNIGFPDISFCASLSHLYMKLNSFKIAA